MKSVQQIYLDYKIMPNLQLHQLRVAAVAKIICDHFAKKVDSRSIILACLFHDMGNIIKSDLNYFLDFLKPQGLEYWQKIKSEYIDKYGTEEHIATEKIANEIGLPSGAVKCLKNIGFSKIDKNEISESFESKICNYADMRVGPYGVLSIEDRLFEANKRYSGRKHAVASDCFELNAQSLRNIEKQIFDNLDIKPEDIDDKKILSVVNELKEF